jgi:hypothetical protein
MKLLGEFIALAISNRIAVLPSGKQARWSIARIA